MTKFCQICGNPIMHGEKVLVGIISTFIHIPSKSTFAVEKPEDFVFINHKGCENLDE